ncbi:capsular polysaccharide synthesis protein [Butyrivibrio sp. VCD2006]|uniref:capsular polysaccharide synthesis protein n=1 Tax=Butyrivibrio sp. VCD2006 TaxID=1280664 RepID=UPI000408731B|nr:capsular polysaccharide synthesis protein [Butyrivibrio sp. VCD2006]
MPGNDNKLLNRIKDRMLLGTIYDQMILRLKYTDEKTNFLYSVMAGQKHRMILYKRFKKRYLKVCTKDRPWEKLPKENNSGTVWIMWLQGIDKAPDIVKRCIESQKAFMPDKKFVFLDETNIGDYVKLPDYIVEKWKKGIIGNALYSDLVRNELLIKYGGYWIDSTVFFTDDALISDIDKLPLFMFSYYYFGFNPEIMELNNWFIHSCTNNNMLCLLQKLLFAYWKDYDHAANYYIYQIFLTIVNEYYEKEYADMPIISQAQSHVLATYIYDDFDPVKYEVLKKTTGVHKLSTRFDADKISKKGTFYDVVINQANN